MADVIMADVVEAAGRTTSGNARSNKRKPNVSSSSDELSPDYGPSIWSDIFEDDPDGREEIERMADELSVHDLRSAKRLKHNQTHTLPPLPIKQNLIAKKQEMFMYSAGKKASSSKDRLRKEMEAEDDGEEMKRVRSRLKGLEEVSRVSERIPEMNYWRNYKAENFRINASSYSKPVNTYDPFSRRYWTTSSSYYRR